VAGKLCPKIILEGTRLTQKTEIAFALNEHPRIVGPRKYRYTSPVISAEWCAFTNIPWGRGLINFDPEEEALAMETYRTWVRLFELLRYYSWIVDRFHLSTQAYQWQARGRKHDFAWLEERLLPLGFRIVLCVRAPESFEAARRERLKVSGKPSQYDDLQAFIREQELFRELVAASRLPTMTLDVTDGDVARAADRIGDWLETTGGLYLA
jgi:thymidylate kinase